MYLCLYIAPKKLFWTKISYPSFPRPKTFCWLTGRPMTVPIPLPEYSQAWQQRMPRHRRRTGNGIAEPKLNTCVIHSTLYQHLARISNPSTQQKDVQTRSSDELGETYVVGGLLKTTIYQQWLRKVDVNRGRGYL